eukprot:2070083-Amphidinium_carterae.1
MSAHSEQLLEQRDAALARGEHDRESFLTSAFRKQMRRDKKAYWDNFLTTYEGPRQNWRAIKQLRSTYKPYFYTRGNRLTFHPQEIPQRTAEYLFQDHWGLSLSYFGLPRPPVTPPDLPFVDSHFTLEELDASINSLKINKSPGPDTITTQDYRNMNYLNKERLLDCCNTMLDTGVLPDSFNESYIVQ